MTIKFNEVTWYSKLAAAVLFLVIVPLLVFYISKQYQETQLILKGISQTTVTNNTPLVPNAAQNERFTDPLNGTYMIGEEQVTFVQGKAERVVAPGSTVNVETRIFGVPTYSDLNNDGKNDAVFYIVQETGGTGVFVYVAGAISQKDGYTGTTAVFLGDRIAPQNINVANGVVVVNFAERAPGEPMATQPSIGKSRFFIVRNGQFVEGEQEWNVPKSQ